MPTLDAYEVFELLIPGEYPPQTVSKVHALGWPRLVKNGTGAIVAQIDSVQYKRSEGFRVKGRKATKGSLNVNLNTGDITYTP